MTGGFWKGGVPGAPAWEGGERGGCLSKARSLPRRFGVQPQGPGLYPAKGFALFLLFRNEKMIYPVGCGQGVGRMAPK